MNADTFIYSGVNGAEKEETVMKKTTRIIVTFFGGWFGLHKYLDKKIGLGVLYTFTFGLFGIGWLYDLFLAFTAPAPCLPHEITSTYGVDLESSTLKTECVRVVGVSYYLENINKLSVYNPEWKSTNAAIVKNGHANTRIYRFTYVNKPVKLIEQPDNPHDPNAVQVVISGELVGYIPSEDCPRIKYILNNRNIKYISGFIGGGEYKIISPDKEMFKHEDNITISVKLNYY